MTQSFSNARTGLRDRLESIPGLRVVDFLPETWSDFPVAVISLSQRRGRIALSGTAFEGEFVVLLFLNPANPVQSLVDLDEYIAPAGAKSVQAAIESDASLGGSVEYANLKHIENVGLRQLGAERCAAADFLIRFVTR